MMSYQFIVTWADKLRPKKEPVRFCKDCKHYEEEPGSSRTWFMCRRTSRMSLVNGGMVTEEKYCEIQRKYDLDGMCGPRGKYFQAK